MTEWRAVPGWEGYYEVSDDGRVRSIDRIVEHPVSGPRRLRGREIRANWDGYPPGGYLYVTLARAGERRNRKVHALVLEAFVGPRPEGLHGCHGPLGKTVNTPGNLRWDTRSANMQDAVREGTHPEVRKTACKRGHPLVVPNLTAAGIRRGARVCVACGIAYRTAAGDESAMQAVSDAAYASLVSPA